MPSALPATLNHAFKVRSMGLIGSTMRPGGPCPAPWLAMSLVRVLPANFAALQISCQIQLDLRRGNMQCIGTCIVWPYWNELNASLNAD